jgi:phytoene dehydrogenase-like protein
VLPEAGNEEGATMNSFITSRGVEVIFQGVATLLDKLEAVHVIPDPPMYQVPLPGTLDSATNLPRTEVHFHNETTLETEADKAAWAEYLTTKSLAEQKHNDALMRLLFMRGIRYPEPIDDAWIKQQEFLGLSVPTDPMERRLHYVQTEVVGTVSDIEQIMLGVMEASSVPQETLAAMRNSFRGQMGLGTGNETRGLAILEKQSGVVLQQPLRTSQSRHQKRAARK